MLLTHPLWIFFAWSHSLLSCSVVACCRWSSISVQRSQTANLHTHRQGRRAFLGNCNQIECLFQQNILLTTVAFAYFHLWNTRTFRWGTRTRHTVLNQVELTGCRSVLPQRTSSMYMPCTSLFIPIGRCTSGLSGLGSVYVSMSPCSQLCGADNNIEATIVHHVMITTKPLPFHRVSLVEKRRFNKGNSWVCVYAWDTATHCCRRCFCMSTLDARVEKVSGTAQQRVKSFPANRENATT